MKNVRINLRIETFSFSNTELEKWVAFVEKYLVYGLKQKGAEVNLIESLSFENAPQDSYNIYIPVFTKTTFVSPACKDRIQEKVDLTGTSKFISIGLIKESRAVEESERLFQDMKLLHMYLIDTDTGLEIGDKDLWKKENFNFLLFKIFDLCNEVEREVQALSITGSSPSTKAIYLAETSPDLIAVREEVRRELLGQGFEVYPEKTLTGGAKAVEKIILGYLQKSVLSVHLFGKLYPETQSGEPSRSEMENKLAANFFLTKKENKKSTSVFKRIIWTPDNLIVQNEKQEKLLAQVQRDKKLYAGADIIRSSVEELKDIVLEKLNEEEPDSHGGNSGSEEEGNRKKNVYIVISEKNKDKIESVKEIVETYGCTVVTNDGLKSSVKDNLSKCNSVLIYCENENHSWLRSKLCEAYKYNRWAYTSTSVRRGIITFENQDLPNDDIFKEIIHVKAQQKLEYENLLSFFNSALK